MSSVQLRPSPNPTARPSVSVGRLFEEYSDRIYGFCLRRLGSTQDAEDAVQMTFLCAHRALQRGVVPESESAWLFAIAKNVCRWQQRTTFRRNRMLTDAELETLAGPTRDDDEELLVGLKEALASIPESQQRALVLREWHGLSSGEVAGRLGMSQPATYALLTRARRSLAHALTTLPQHAALGLVALVYEARSHLKALLGGSAATKTIAATTMVAAVTVGGVTVERVVDNDRSAPAVRQPLAPAVSDPVSPLRSRSREGAAPISFGGVGAPVGTTPAVGATTLLPVPAAGEPPATASTPGETSADPTPQPGESGPAPKPDLTELQKAAPEPPPLPELPPIGELPPLPGLPPLPDLPPIPEVPPLPALPPLPAADLPPLPEPPSVEVPPLAPVDLPPPPPLPELLPKLP